MIKLSLTSKGQIFIKQILRVSRHNFAKEKYSFSDRECIWIQGVINSKGGLIWFFFLQRVVGLRIDSRASISFYQNPNMSFSMLQEWIHLWLLSDLSDPGLVFVYNLAFIFCQEASTILYILMPILQIWLVSGTCFSFDIVKQFPYKKASLFSSWNKIWEKRGF